MCHELVRGLRPDALILLPQELQSRVLEVSLLATDTSGHQARGHARPLPPSTTAPDSLSGIGCQETWLLTSATAVVRIVGGEGRLVCAGAVVCLALHAR